MFFLLSKIFLFLISPLTWIIIFLLLSIVTKNPIRRNKFLLTSLVLTLFFSNTFIFDRFMHAWEVKTIPEVKIENFDAAILLTGMATFDSKNDRLEFNDRTDRLMQAINIYKEKKVSKIILCGGPATIGGNDTVEGPLLKNYLITLGIDSNDMILEMHSRNTHENAVNIKPMLEKLFPDGKFLLISSAWHLKRATACFIKEGINVIPYSTDRYSGPVKFDFDYLFIPSSATLFNWEKLTHEWVGTIAYWTTGYI